MAVHFLSPELGFAPPSSLGCTTDGEWWLLQRDALGVVVMVGCAAAGASWCRRSDACGVAMLPKSTPLRA